MDLTSWWGLKEEISPLEISLRAAAMFGIMLIMLRFAGMRSFGMGSVFDNVIIILLGSVLGRGVVGATPFFSALAAGVVMLVIHKFLSKLTFFNKWAGRKIKGEPTLLYKGDFLLENMKQADITHHDILEELRTTMHTNKMDDIDEVYMERSGKLSFIGKPKYQS